MRQALAAIDAFTLHFEFAIPRMGKRVDAVVVIGDGIFVIEFKVGSDTFDRHAIEQVEDYALDLKNFHRGSHDLSIIPVLVPTLAVASRDIQLELALDQVAKPFCLSVADLGPVIAMIGARHKARPFDAGAWAASGYRPTPTIIEAARTLYARHDVRDIARSDADAINLGRTQDALAAVIEDAKANRRKSVCFVTGVPGAGKTLAGLNIATQRSEAHQDEHAVFLSGNGPLVDVLREALTRDQASRTGQSRAHVERKVRAFIQNIHKFRDEYVATTEAPVEHVVVFDEAQRAWTKARPASSCSRNAPSPISTCPSRNSCSTSWIVMPTGARSSAWSAAARKSIPAKPGCPNGWPPSATASRTGGSMPPTRSGSPTTISITMPATLSPAHR